jgi:hypothetical protein
MKDNIPKCMPLFLQKDKIKEILKSLDAAV